VRFFKDKDEALEAGEREEDLVTIHARNQKEHDAVALALQFGNRKQRRMRRFRPHLIVSTQETGATTPDIPAHVRDERNAKRRVAKKQRKRNGGK
jgi:hypothetical protein